MSGYSPVGTHFLFSLIATLVMLGGFTTIALVMLWAPKAPLVRGHDAPPPPRERREDTGRVVVR